MNKFWVVIVLLLSMNLMTSDTVKADDALIKVEIYRDIDPTRQLKIPGLQRSYSWEFENKFYTALIVIDEQWYNRIRNQKKKRMYNHRHFPPMVDQGTKALRELINEFKQVMPKDWEEERKVNFVLAFVQSIPWTDDKRTGYDEFYKYATETLAEGQGDCEDTSILFAAILSGFGFKSALLDLPGHLAVGVNGNFRGDFVPYGNDKYYYCETTSKHRKLGNMPKEYVGKRVEVMPITPNPVRPKQVTPQIVTPRPKLPSPPSPQRAFQNGINLYKDARYNEAIKSLQLALSGLSKSEQRAQVYIYLGAAELGFGKSIPEVKDRFQEALRQNSNQELPWPNHRKFKPLFEEVRRESIGKLTISSSLPQTEIWIYGNEFNRKKLGTRASRINLKLFKGKYTIEGIYKGISVEKQVEIKPNSHEELEIEIPPIMNHQSVSEVSIGEIIPITLSLTSRKRPDQVKIHYKIYDKNDKELGQYIRKMLLSRRQPTSSTWIYDVNLPLQRSAGSIKYHIEAEYEDRLVVRDPKSRYRYYRISVVDDTPTHSNLPPKIVLIDPILTAEVNQRIPIKAKVTDDVSVKSVYLFYGFSRSRTSEPSKYYMKVLTKTPLDIYTGHISSQSKVGYVWYYLTAIDREGNQNQMDKRVLEIKPSRRYTPPQPDPNEKPRTHAVNKPDIPLQQEIWANYAWSSNVFEDGASVFNWNRGDMISLTYMCESRTHQMFGAQLDYSFQSPSNMSVTFQWGPALEKSSIAFTLLGGITRYSNSDSTRTSPNFNKQVSDESNYITPILGASLKYYPQDRVTVDITGSLKLPSNFDTTYLYHYEIGTRIYINDSLNLKIGYSQWYLGGWNIKRMQIGFGITF